MKRGLIAQRAALRWRERTRTVPLNSCYHFRGSRYGGFGNNPYEDYIVGLATNRSLQELRSRFAALMLNCGPRSMGDALDIDVDPWAPWDFPWEPSSPSSLTPIEDPSENPDVVCHFCEAGVLASHVNREFAWLESAFASVSAHGYQPRSGGHIRCLVLVGDDRSSFIVLDGNHRISALHALGVDRVEVKVSRRATVRRDQVDRWPGVLNGSHSIADSLRVFDRYFDEVNRPWRCLNPARLIVDEPPLW